MHIKGRDSRICPRKEFVTKCQCKNKSLIQNKESSWQQNQSNIMKLHQNSNLLNLQHAHKKNTYKFILKIRASEASEEILQYFIAWKPFQMIKIGLVGFFELPIHIHIEKKKKKKKKKKKGLQFDITTKVSKLQSTSLLTILNFT